ncbi:MAG: Gfo/Idh/MocA family oxidoreductase [Sedimentisphaerales bacterium]|nr:Gfo/Idh/MocA family oxidoreductase [Sedimentisphaerales bacterium]
MSKVRVAIIGQGRSGRDIHADWLKQDKGRYKIVAIADPMKDRRDRATEELGCEAYKDYHELFNRDDLDLIVNTVPSHMHVSVALEILNAGFNCLTEKPFAGNVKDVDKMIAAAKKAKRLLAVFQQSRYAPYFEQVRKVVDSGVLGRIVQINIAFNKFARRYDWQTLQEFMGGELMNTGPHPLDQALQFFGTDIMPEVFCHMDLVNAKGDAEDHCTMSLRGAGRPLVNVEISTCCAYSRPTYQVYGSCGGLEGTMSEAKWRYFDPTVVPKAPRLSKKPLRNADGTPAYPKTEIKWTERKWKVPKSQSDLFTTISKRFYAMLHNTLTKGVALEIPPEQVRQQIAVIEECQRQNPHIYGKK